VEKHLSKFAEKSESRLAPSPASRSAVGSNNVSPRDHGAETLSPPSRDRIVSATSPANSSKASGKLSAGMARAAAISAKGTRMGRSVSSLELGGINPERCVIL
jgi:hypothetical protein